MTKVKEFPKTVTEIQGNEPVTSILIYNYLNNPVQKFRVEDVAHAMQELFNREDDFTRFQNSIGSLFYLLIDCQRSKTAIDFDLMGEELHDLKGLHEFLCSLTSKAQHIGTSISKLKIKGDAE